MAKFNHDGLPEDGPERDEAEQMYEDFLVRQAEEHQLMEEEKKEKEEPMQAYLRGLKKSFEAMGQVMDTDKYKFLKGQMSASGSYIWTEIEKEDINNISSEEEEK